MKNDNNAPASAQPDRGAFERWALSVGYEVDTFKAEDETTYSATFANVAWEAWQAALDAKGKASAANAGGLAKLLDALANCGGTIVSTAALDTVQIAAARMENRMYVREDGCGFVHMPRRASAFNAEPYNKFMREWSEGWTKDADKHSGSQSTTSAADAKDAGVLTTLLQAVGAMRMVRCHDGSGEPFEAYDKSIADRVVHRLTSRIAKLRAALQDITNVPQGYGPDSSATDIANEALFSDSEGQAK